MENKGIIKKIIFSIVSRLNSMLFILFIIAIMWIGFLLQKVYPELSSFGLIPRTRIGAIGIISSPFLHGNLNHIYSNTIGLFLFGMVYSFFDGFAPKSLFFLITFYSGLFVWLLAPSANYIGMSGVIFGLYGYTLMIGFFKANFKHILLSTFMILIYGSVLFTMISFQKNVASVSHVIGFLTGCFWAKYFQE